MLSGFRHPPAYFLGNKLDIYPVGSQIVRSGRRCPKGGVGLVRKRLVVLSLGERRPDTGRGCGVRALKTALSDQLLRLSGVRLLLDSLTGVPDDAVEDKAFLGVVDSRTNPWLDRKFVVILHRLLEPVQVCLAPDRREVITGYCYHQ